MRILDRHWERITRGDIDRSDLPAVDITGAAKWYFEESPQDDWDMLRDIPVAVPPFDIMWMEFAQPRYSNDGGKRVELPYPLSGSHWGCTVQAYKLSDDEVQSLRIRDLFEGSGTPYMPGYTGRVAATLDSGQTIRWTAMYDLYWEDPHGELEFVYNFRCYLDGSGAVLPGLYVMSRRPEGAGMDSIVLLMPFLFAISLMHAKNVQLEDIPVPPAVAKKRTQKTGEPPIIYKTLVITPMQASARGASTPGGDGPRRAMHLVRGHFKDYRTGAGLFGKRHGLYWWDMSVHGAESAGKVIKDYTLKPPQSGGGNQ